MPPLLRLAGQLVLLLLLIMIDVECQQVGNPLLAQFRSQRSEPPTVQNGHLTPTGQAPSPVPAPGAKLTSADGELSSSKGDSASPTPAPTFNQKKTQINQVEQNGSARRSQKFEDGDFRSSQNRKMVFVILVLCALIILCMLGVAVWKFVSATR